MNAPASSADDLNALIAKVRVLDDECCLILSGKQQRWLEDILESADKDAPQVTPNGLKFLQSIVDGRYSDGLSECAE